MQSGGPGDVEGQVHTYDDLVQQEIDISVLVDANNFGGNDNSGPLSDGLNYEPVDGLLGRNQFAELVTFKVMYLTSALEIPSGGAEQPGNMRYETDIFLGGSTDGRTQSLNASNDLDTDDDGNTEVVLKRNSRHNPNRLFRHVGSVSQQHKDTTNGTGGGGQLEDLADIHYVNYRKEYGRGPIAFPTGDNLRWFFSLFNNGISDVDVNFHAMAVMMWDVYETDDPVHEVLGHTA